MKVLSILFPCIISIFLNQISIAVATKYYDLGYDLDDTSLFYPGQRFGYEMFKDVHGYNETIPEHNRYWFAQYSFCMGDHGGTHLDAPFHFYDKGWKLGEIPLNRLVDVKAVVIDVEPKVFAMRDPRDFALEVEHLLEHERKYGQIPKESVILVYTGWDRFYPDKPTYWGIENGTFNFPGLSLAAAEWLWREKQIVGLGIDTQSIDVGNFGVN